MGTCAEKPAALALVTPFSAMVMRAFTQQDPAQSDGKLSQAGAWKSL
jgi:hypothetical protein